jgi:hypothetical protein
METLDRSRLVKGPLICSKVCIARIKTLQGCLHSLEAAREKLRKRILEAARRGARIKDLEQELEDAKAKIANRSVENHEHQTRGGDLEQVTSSSRKMLFKVC